GWSSDVCSSDLAQDLGEVGETLREQVGGGLYLGGGGDLPQDGLDETGRLGGPSSGRPLAARALAAGRPMAARRPPAGHSVTAALSAGVAGPAQSRSGGGGLGPDLVQAPLDLGGGHAVEPGVGDQFL